MVVKIRVEEFPMYESKAIFYNLGESFLTVNMYKDCIKKEFSFGHSYPDDNAPIHSLCKLINEPSYSIYDREIHCGRPNIVWKAQLDDDSIKKIDNKPERMLPIIIVTDYLLRDSVLCAQLNAASQVAYSKTYGEYAHLSKAWLERKLANLADEISKEKVVLVPEAKVHV